MWCYNWPSSKKIQNVSLARACISTFTSANKHCIALCKSVFVYNILLDDVGYMSVQSMLLRPLDQP